MSFNKVEVRVFSGPDQVQVGSNTEPDLIVINNGPKGDPGAAGNTGPAGPNSVTSATTSDGTADLQLSSIIIADNDGYINTTGTNAFIGTEGDDAFIGTSGSTAYIRTSGNNSYIATLGADATIDTSGIRAKIETRGAEAHIETQHASASVKSSNFQSNTSNGSSLENISGTPCLSWGSSSGQNLTIPSGIQFITNTTIYTYGTGAAAAHRTALGVSASGDTVLKSAYTPAHSLLVQQSGTGSPSSLSVGNNTILGRASGGGSNIAALSGSDARTVLGLTTLATTTPAANVATFLATPSSANLAAAVTDETGSGSLVFAESPSLTSPTIGTSATFNATTYTYGAGAAAAHRTALGFVSKSKASSTSRSSTTTRTADPDLTFEIGANETWIFELSVLISQHASSIQVSSQLTSPSGALISGRALTGRDGGVAGTTLFQSLNAPSLISTRNGSHHITATVISSATAGTVAFAWAQETSNATASVVALGSYIQATRIS